MNRIRTDILEIAFEEGGPPDGTPVLLLHGWPDAPRGWNEVSQRLGYVNEVGISTSGLQFGC
jgi:pimeloyl-ACP methyl ester carboxylesterase